MKHSKLPCEINKSRTVRNGIDYFNCEILSADGNVIAWTEDPLKEKDFEFIVRAFNSHDELLLALKDACLLIKETLDIVTPELKLSQSERFMALIETVKKAEGK